MKRNPWNFTVAVLKAFKANQGLLLAGALGYYILLSIIPLFTLILLALSHIVDEAALMGTLSRYIGIIVPGKSEAILRRSGMCWRTARWLGGFVLITMLFFSSLAFTVLENAMSIIFVHRVKESRRSLLVSLVLPYIYILLLGVGFLVMTGIAGLLQSMGDNQIVVLGRGWSLNRFSFVLLYLAGVAGLIAVLASIYLVLPPGGRVTPRHALVGAAVVGVLWEITRHFLLWYFSALSLVGVVYGSLATTIVGLLSLEIARDAGPQGAQEAFRKLFPLPSRRTSKIDRRRSRRRAHCGFAPFFPAPETHPPAP